ncbi:putative phage-associated protein [Mesorhizobium sp. USDA 4775]
MSFVSIWARIGYGLLFSFVKRGENHYLDKKEEVVSCTESQWGNGGQQSKSRLMEYTPQHIANYFLDRAKKEGRTISPMKLIKLVYIAYGWVLALTGKRLFQEKIQAWKHGPVIPSLYHEFKHFRSDPINEKAMRFDLDTFDAVEPRIDPEDKESNFILDKVWSVYKHFSGSTLRAKTHEADTPWSRVYNPEEMDTQIRDKDIAEHYQNRIKRYLDAAS